ncbi:phosphomannomutase [Pseudomonas syringae pv. spinaceae]|uniref:Phosphomannomutase n=1 Tax=Pseudomonas syringae pv. spinaceae TaxID=264459 RepID=A0A0P9Z730_PSESX|nr:phosphomannomutase [Pseudomonas syringae pv. spinaceae]
MGRAFSAVSGAKSVHHEHVAQGRVLLRQLVGVLFLALVEANVLEQHDIARLDVNAVQVIGDQRNVTTQCLAQVFSNRLEAVFSRKLALGRTAKVRADHDSRAFFQRQPDGRQRSKNTCIAADNAVLYRDVEVFADQYTFTLQIEVGHLQDGHEHSCFFTVIGQRRAKSDQRRRAFDWQSPTRYRTRPADSPALDQKRGSDSHRQSPNAGHD